MSAPGLIRRSHRMRDAQRDTNNDNHLLLLLNTASALCVNTLFGNSSICRALPRLYVYVNEGFIYILDLPSRSVSLWYEQVANMMQAKVNAIQRPSLDLWTNG